MTFKVMLVPEDEGGFSVRCPGLPGCWSQGETEEEALENIADAIREYLLSVAETEGGDEVRVVEVKLDVA